MQEGNKLPRANCGGSKKSLGTEDRQRLPAPTRAYRVTRSPSGRRLLRHVQPPKRKQRFGRVRKFLIVGQDEIEELETVD